MGTDHAPRTATTTVSVLRHLAVATVAATALSACATDAGSAADLEEPSAPPAAASASPAVVREGPGTGESYFAGTDVGVTLTLPAGWSTEDVSVFRSGTDPSVALTFADVGNIYSDPCRWVPLDPVGPTVDDLVSALESSAVLDAAAARDVSVDGYEGTHLVVSVPAYDEETCGGGKFGLWKEDGPFGVESGDHPNLWSQAPGQRCDVWALDVDGTRLVVGGTTHPDTPAEDLAAMEAMVSSLQVG